MSFSLVPLLLAEGEVPAQAREALLENRRQDAAEVLMQEYGLSCSEAGQLLDVAACDAARRGSKKFVTTRQGK